jgi:methionine-S-sulfoxide reductase
VNKKTAIFAGGCFWCTQKAFDHIKGVLKTRVGYTGGKVKNPTYEEVCSGTTGHVEALEIIYDSDIVSYEKLLHVFWESIDPKNFKGQYCDIGTQYMPVIFYKDEYQKKLLKNQSNNKSKH